jgi:hypothetical protein
MAQKNTAEVARPHKAAFVTGKQQCNHTPAPTSSQEYPLDPYPILLGLTKGVKDDL